MAWNNLKIIEKYKYPVVIVLLLLFLYITRNRSYYIHTNVYDSATMAHWIPKHTMYDSAEIVIGKVISRDSMKIENDDSTIVKITKISRHLVTNFHEYLGTPKEFVFNETPLQSYNSIKNKTTELFCTQYSLIFTFFCRINNIVTRRIESYGKNDRHTFNEVFLPESKEWVFVDLTNNILYTKKGNKYISLRDFYSVINNNDSLKKISMLSIIDSHDLMVPAVLYRDTLVYNFDDRCEFLFHFEKNEKEYYKTVNRIKRYLKSEGSYMYYSNIPVNHIYVYMKYICFAGILVCIFLFFKKRHYKK